jgi:hypothetical protein
MKGNGFTVSLSKDTDIKSAKQWCQQLFGPENPNVWCTLEPGWSIGSDNAHFTKESQMVMFILNWL